MIGVKLPEILTIIICFASLAAAITTLVAIALCKLGAVEGCIMLGCEIATGLVLMSGY